MAKANELDCGDPLQVIARRLAAAIMAKVGEHMTQEDLVTLLSEILDHPLVDEELQESIVVALAKTYGLTPIAMVHEINQE